MFTEIAELDSAIPEDLALVAPDAMAFLQNQLDLLKTALANIDSGVDGSFTTTDGKTITVSGGIVTSIV